MKPTKAVTIGITSVLSSISGKLSAIKIKDVGTQVEAGKSLATIESSRYFGVVRAPFTGRIIELNNHISLKPKIVNDFPYSEGWFAKMEPLYPDRYLVNLQPIQDCRDKMKTVIQNLHTRCFVAYPDYEMYEIGVECAATGQPGRQTGQLGAQIPKGNVDGADGACGQATPAHEFGNP